MDDDVYQKMGLLTLFVGGTPPDIYFQWGGFQVRQYAAAGYALDLSSEFPPERRSEYLATCWPSATQDDGRVFLWPNSASVTVVLWYRKSIFQKHGLESADTWADFLALCRKARDAGLVPLAVGNRELWPGANLAAGLAARQAGSAGYRAVLGLDRTRRLDDPAFLAAFTALDDLRAQGFISTGPNGVGVDEARSLLEQGRAALHPTGDWLASEVDPADAADLDCFRLPVLPDQQGDPSALLALSTGYMIYRQTRHPELCLELLRHLGSAPVQREFTRHGHLSGLRALGPESDASGGARRIWGFLEEAKETALAPDIGFNLEVSDAFLDAVSLLLDGRQSPAAALQAAERQIAALRGASAS